MKFLTIRQPWATLIAVGAKTIETRPFSTKYRGPLAIHAGRAWPVPVGEWQVPNDRVPGPMIERVIREGSVYWEQIQTPLGAVVAVCDLVDVVPIVQGDTCPDHPHFATPKPDAPANRLVMCDPEHRFQTDRYHGQLPFGDFTPGRFAWLLDNVRPIDPVPMKGAQGLRDLPEAVVIP